MLQKGKYQRKSVTPQKPNAKNLFKVAIWAIALLATTAALGAGYTVFSQAFGTEDKASAVELCRFGAQNVTDFDQMRTITTGSGNHIFLQNNVKYTDGTTAGFIAFKETTTEDPCAGVTNIATTFNGVKKTDLSVQNWYLYDWKMTNAVYVPDEYSEKDDDGYIAVFLRENTTNYTKKSMVVILQYLEGEITVHNTLTAFADNANFSTIVNALYSYDANTLYVLGTTESDGVKNRGMQLASISQEDVISGKSNFYYCSPSIALDTRNNCTWETEVKKSKNVIATKAGEMDVIGLNDTISLLLQNDGQKVMVYDLAANGSVWNPGLQLLDCSGTTNCSQIVTYDYQMSMFENTEEKLKLMTFNFIQTYEGKAILYEATIKDFAVAEVNASNIVPDLSIQSVMAKRKDDSGVTSRPESPKVKAESAPVKKNKDNEKEYVATVTKPKAAATKVVEKVTGKSEAKAVTQTKKTANASIAPTKVPTTVETQRTKGKLVEKKPQQILVTKVDSVKAQSDSYTGIKGSNGGGNNNVVKAPVVPRNGAQEIRVGIQKGTYATASKTGTVATTTKQTSKPTVDIYGCEPGTTYNKVKDTCIKTVTLNTNKPVITASVCPKGWGWDNRSKECVEPTAKATVALVNKKKTCDYGYLNSSNKANCNEILPKCGSTATANKGNNCKESVATYSAYKKCTTGDKIVSCCPENTILTSTGKCAEYGVDLEEKVDGKTKERCKLGSVLPEEKQFCEAAIPLCDNMSDGKYDDLSCQNSSLERASVKKCRSANEISTCCAKGSKIVKGKCVAKT